MKSKKLTGWLAAALIGAAALPVTGFADDGVVGDIGVFSQYVWRGVPQNSSKTAVQGDLKGIYGPLTGSVWFSNSYPSPAPQYAGRDAVEFDWTLDYSDKAGDFGYSAGTVLYSYLYDSASNFPEVYLGANYAGVVTPSIKVSYNVKDSQNKGYLRGDTWVDMGLSGAVGDFSVAGTLSYAKWKQDTVVRPVLVGGPDKYKSGLSTAIFSVSKSVALTGLTLTPSFTASLPMAKKATDGNRYIYGVPAKTEVIFGVNASY